MKKNLPFLGLFLCAITHAQVGINIANTDLSANLHVESKPTSMKGTLLNPMTSAQRNSIPSPASGLIVYDTDQKCLMTNNGTPSATLWECPSSSSNTAAYKHLFYSFNLATMATATAYTTTGTRPSDTSNNNVVGYLTNNDPDKLNAVPAMDGIRMNAVFYNKGSNGTIMNPIIENISGNTLTDFVALDQSTVSGPKRIPYDDLPNNNYINVDPDGIVYYDNVNFETAIAVINHNGKMYRCTWWGYYGGTPGTHHIHMTMEVFN